MNGQKIVLFDTYYVGLSIVTKLEQHNRVKAVKINLTKVELIKSEKTIQDNTTRTSGGERAKFKLNAICERNLQ